MKAGVPVTPVVRASACTSSISWLVDGAFWSAAARARSTPLSFRMRCTAASSRFFSDSSAWCTGQYLPCALAAMAARLAVSETGDKIGNSFSTNRRSLLAAISFWMSGRAALQ